MSEEDIDFLISIQDLEQPDFDNACLERENERLNKENQRLNNIIDELEKYLEQQWLEWKNDSNDEIVAMAQEDKVILDKLKELKGSVNK